MSLEYPMRIPSFVQLWCVTMVRTRALWLSVLLHAPATANPPQTLTTPNIPPPVPLYEVDLAAPHARLRLAELGIDLQETPIGPKARILGWPGAREELRALGLPFRELSRDFGRDLARRNGVAPRGEVLASPGTVWNVPPMGQGSIAGFWSTDEVYAFLDSISTTDPFGIVGPVETIGTSVDGRSILAVVVTDLSRPLGTRPAVLYNALTHAREPAGMQALLYFLSRLIQGYGTDPELTYLVNEREMWFVPIVNPDGYETNCMTWRQTGSYGFVRKNSNQVDLNRNFGYAWGYDNVGSSNKRGAETYRGSAPFSEPETQALRDFCMAKRFVTAENFHTFGELCLYPWSYIYPGPPDSSRFMMLADERMQGVGYRAGQSPRILYGANGVSADWMYGENALKPATFAMSTEVGSREDEFWPPPSRILPLAELNFRSNLVLAYAAGPYVVADSLRIEGANEFLAPGEGKPVVFRLMNRGMNGTGEGLQVSVTSQNPFVTASDSELIFPDLGSEETSWPMAGSCLLTAHPTCIPGTRVPLIVAISGNQYAGRDTLTFRVGQPITVFADQAGSGLGNWTAQGTWGVEVVEGNPVFSVSPGGPYPQYTTMSLTLNSGLDLSGVVNAVLRYRTRWDIEAEMDFGRVEASLDGGLSWIPLRGDHMLMGHGTQGSYQYGTQTDGHPGYLATQRRWIDEDVDLAQLAGHSNVRFRFRLTSDLGDTGDGWWIDDITFLAYAPVGPVGVAETGTLPVFLAAAPNPTRGPTRIAYALRSPGLARLALYDVAGRLVRVLSQGLVDAGERSLVWDGLDASGRIAPPGAYFLRLEGPVSTDSFKLLVTH